MKFLFALTFACVVASTFAQLAPSDCEWYERWRSCQIDQTCEGILLGQPPFLPRPRPCVASCICPTGQVRDQNNDCVWPEECYELPACSDPNAVRVPCANRCPGGTCSHPNFSLCYMACEVNGCQCRPGWLMQSSRNPECVPEGYCNLIGRRGGLAASGSASVESEEDGGYN
nr:zonadhesin-like protein 3B [Limnephilus flavicornis]